MTDATLHQEEGKEATHPTTLEATQAEAEEVLEAVEAKAEAKTVVANEEDLVLMNRLLVITADVMMQEMKTTTVEEETLETGMRTEEGEDPDFFSQLLIE